MLMSNLMVIFASRIGKKRRIYTPTTGLQTNDSKLCFKEKENQKRIILFISNKMVQCSFVCLKCKKTLY